MAATVPGMLNMLGMLYNERNALYGAAYKRFGRLMINLFPEPVTLTTEDDWNRMALFFHVAGKLARYAANFQRGGSKDSLDDLSIYAMMLQECDAELNEKNKQQQETKTA